MYCSYVLFHSILCLKKQMKICEMSVNQCIKSWSIREFIILFLQSPFKNNSLWKNVIIRSCYLPIFRDNKTFWTPELNGSILATFKGSGLVKDWSKGSAPSENQVHMSLIALPTVQSQLNRKKRIIWTRSGFGKSLERNIVNFLIRKDG